MTTAVTTKAIDDCFARVLLEDAQRVTNRSIVYELRKFSFYDIFARYVALLERTHAKEGLRYRVLVMKVINQMIQSPAEQLAALSDFARIVNECPGEAERLASCLFDTVSRWSESTMSSSVLGLFTKEIYDVIFAHAESTSREDYLCVRLERDSELDDDIHQLCTTLAKNWTGTWDAMVETATQLVRAAVPV
jgi:hypothetical protein